MKRLLILVVLCTLPLMLAPRGGSSSQVKNQMPTCTATSGACPSDSYFCQDATAVVYVCRTTGSPLGWTAVTVAAEAITEAKLYVSGSATDEYCLTYEADDGGDFVWQSCGAGGGSAIVLDLSNDDSDESSGVTEIATAEAVPLIITEPSADKILIDTTQDWPNATTATGLESDPTDCAVGLAAGGINASAAAESCIDPITEDDMDSEAEFETQWCNEDVDCTGGTDDGNIINENEIDTVAELNTIISGSDGLLDTNAGGTITNAVVVDGADDEIQMIVQAAGGQTAGSDVFVVEESDGTDLFNVKEDATVEFGDPGDGSRGWTFVDNSSGNEPGAAAVANQTNMYVYDDGTDTNLYIHSQGATNPSLVPMADDSAKRGIGYWCDGDTHVDGDACCPGTSVCIIVLDPGAGIVMDDIACTTDFGSGLTGSADGWYLAICRAG